MTGLIPIVLLGTLVLLLAGRLVVGQAKIRDSDAVTANDYAAAHGALESVFVETAAIRRIFSAEDRAFISESGRPDVQRLFARERKRLAVQWLRGTRKQVARLMDLHLKLASYTSQPNPKFEFSLTVKYLCFVLAANGLLVILWLFGPFHAARIASCTMRLVEQFCSALSFRLEKVNSIKLSSAR